MDFNVTVISLSYNNINLIKSIDSVIHQSYPNIEYIIIDDGSAEFDLEETWEYVTTNKSDSIKKFIILHNEKKWGPCIHLTEL